MASKSNKAKGTARETSPRRRLSSPRRRPAQLLPDGANTEVPDTDAYVDCGWGRLIFSHTFKSANDVIHMLGEEGPDRRDIAFYVEDPHVLLASAPQDVFLDPSHSYRVWLAKYRPRQGKARGFFIRRVQNAEDGEAINTIYAKQRMVQVPLHMFMEKRTSRALIHLVAEDEKTGAIVGTVTGIDHFRTFNDPEKGTSLWCLAVDPQAPFPGVGEALVRHLIEHFVARGRTYLDLSVMHDNEQAIKLYEKIGFERISIFCVKRKNPINERLFTAPQPTDDLNPYAQIIINEALRRGIAVDVEDAEAGLFTLSHGGRQIACRESLSDLTSAVAMSRCDDKALTIRLLSKNGLRVPDQQEAGNEAADLAFLERHGRIVVKPARGEQGAGISVDIGTAEDMKAAIKAAAKVCDRVLLEEYCSGQDLRIIVIGGRVIAAAIRRPATIIGNGRDTISALIKKQSRRREAASGGESRIPLDSETKRCVRQAGYDMETVLEEGTELAVRKTANLHTGGTLHDVTDILHPKLIAAAEKAAKILDIPVTGFDFLVPGATQPDYVIIEANERPGLANHEPQPTAERFIDLLFPQVQGSPR